MNAWMRTLIGLGGMVLAAGNMLVGTGCTSGTFELELEATPYKLRAKLLFTPLGPASDFDLDGENYIVVFVNGKRYYFYPSLGRFLDPSTGQLYQLDDASWQRLFDELEHLDFISTNSNYIVISEDNRSELGAIFREIVGGFTPMLQPVVAIPSSYIEIELSLLGDVPIPTWDVERWPTLDRKLFVFPDGVVGSVDPMRLELIGKPSDVFGYLAELGVTESTAIVGGSQWKLFIDEKCQFADVYFDGVLFTTVELH